MHRSKLRAATTASDRNTGLPVAGRRGHSSQAHFIATAASTTAFLPCARRQLLLANTGQPIAGGLLWPIRIRVIPTALVAADAPWSGFKFEVTGRGFRK